ncbi:MAG: hypothetical protein ACI8R4_003742 [Paracoccaceae bacterium]|jgi:hypothetical protein
MRVERGTGLRWLSRAPALLAVGLVVLIIGIIVAANVRRSYPNNYVPDPDRPDPDRPVTAPPDQPVTEPATGN